MRTASIVRMKDLMDNDLYEVVDWDIPGLPSLCSLTSDGADSEVYERKSDVILVCDRNDRKDLIQMEVNETGAKPVMKDGKYLTYPTIDIREVYPWRSLTYEINR